MKTKKFKGINSYTAPDFVEPTSFPATKLVVFKDGKKQTIEQDDSVDLGCADDFKITNLLEAGINPDSVGSFNSSNNSKLTNLEQIL